MNTMVFKNNKETKALEDSYNVLHYFQEIDEIMKSNDVDKQRLLKLVSILKVNSFEAEAFKLEIKYSEIKAIIDDKITPYEKSFYEAGLLLNEDKK